MRARCVLCPLIVALLASQAANAGNPRAFELLKTAMALTPNADHGEVLYAKHCSACHGARAGGSGPREVPALAGQREYYVLEQLVFFSALERNAPAMHDIVKRPDLDHAQALRDLAAYLSHASGQPTTDRGDGHALAAGERIYSQTCAACHGRRGEGSDNEPIPAIGGQHYRYLLAQLEAFPTGHRSYVEPPVLDFTAGLSPDERKAVADYVSRLTTMSVVEKH
jgi:cytochrome c553